MSSQIQYKSDFIGSFIFFFLRIAYWIQSFVAYIFWWIFIVPAIQLTKILNIEKNEIDKSSKKQDNDFVKLDLLKWQHKLLWSYLNFLFSQHKRLSGVLHRYHFFRKLMNWNPSIPLMGFVEDKTFFTIKLLYEFYKDNRSRRCNLSWLSKSNFYGTFQIISKELRTDAKNKESLLIKCLWLSGKEQGTIFEITKSQLFDNKEKSQTLPSTIFYPPRPIIFVFELLLSASAILTFWEITKDGWIILANLITKLWHNIINYFN